MRGWLAGLAAMALCAGAFAQTDTGAAEVTKATQAWLASLDAAQRTAAKLPMDSAERPKWAFVPMARLGVPLKTQSETQQALALDLVKASLSAAGFDVVATIRRLEVVLRDELKHNPGMRDPDMYYLLVFGEPTDKGAWALRIEGHHVSLNLTFADGQVVSSTPQFVGSNPHRVMEGSMKGTRFLGAFEDGAKEIVDSMDDAQRAKGVVPGEVPADILTRADPIATPPDATQGILYSELKPAQQTTLMKLLEEAAGVQRPGVAASRMKKVREIGLDKVRFVWIGSTGPGEKQYYRIQGPTFVFEYDNTQDNANHSHTVWRDFTGDFARDLLQEHYKTVHSSPTGAIATAR